jgi:hypothetical protein
MSVTLPTRGGGLLLLPDQALNRGLQILLEHLPNGSQHPHAGYSHGPRRARDGSTVFTGRTLCCDRVLPVFLLPLSDAQFHRAGPRERGHYAIRFLTDNVGCLQCRNKLVRLLRESGSRPPRRLAD